MIHESEERAASTSSASLGLKGGGASRRRSSISSNTSSVASTSRVRIGDIEDDLDDGTDDEAGDAVELGFAEKMKKGFKVVKDVGKIGGKPTWLNPAMPLETTALVCQICTERMTYLIQVRVARNCGN